MVSAINANYSYLHLVRNVVTWAESLARIAAILDVRGHRLPTWRDAPLPIQRQRPF